MELFKLPLFCDSLVDKTALDFVGDGTPSVPPVIIIQDIQGYRKRWTGFETAIT